MLVFCCMGQQPTNLIVEVSMCGSHEADNMDNPKKMLAELIELSTKTKQWGKHVPVDYNDAKALLATFGDKLKSSNQDPSDNIGDDVKILRRSRTPSLSSNVLATPSVHTTLGLLDLAAVPPNLAKENEKKEIEDLVRREEDKLNAIIAQTFKEEVEPQARRERKYRPSRLILSNLATDIDVQAIREFFTKYERHM